MKKSLKKIAIYSLFIPFLLSLGGCESNENEVKVGAIFSSTGVAGDYGKKSVEGIELAADLINKEGGIKGKKIKLIVEDAMSSNKDAISAYRKLVDVNKANYIIGDIYSTTTKAIIGNLSKDILLFAPGASRPDLVGLSNNFLRNWTSDDFDGYAMSRVIQSQGFNRTSVLTQQNDYTLALKEAFVKDFQSNGKVVDDDGFFTEDQLSYKELLLKLKNKNVKAVYLIGMSKQAGQMLKDAKEIGFNPQWFANLTVNTDDCKLIAGEAINGVIFSEPFVDKTTKEWTDFHDLYVEKYSREPDATAAHSFDALKILSLALSNTDNIQDAISYINSIKDYVGVSGNTTFDGKGGVVKDIEVLQFRNNTAERIEIFKFNDKQ
ncbi:MAG: ABC transporter substrate-binding protein [Suipraeoptans sp.]